MCPEQAVPLRPSDDGEQESANDRFKKSFGAWLWSSMIAATVIHFAFFVLFPKMQAADVSYEAHELEAIELPPEIEIPPPPEQIARPATPVVSADARVDEDITIAPTTFEENPVEDLPPPPTGEGEGDISAAPTFTPYTVAPELRNRREVLRALQREYPPMLRQAGIGGTVEVWFFIDEEGRVLDARINESSGHKLLDEAALRVADVYRFSPALNRDQRVKVWVSIPITFRLK